MDDPEMQKLEVKLSHWISHNKEHGRDFREWSEKAEEAGMHYVHEHMLQAAQQMDEASECLARALELLKK